jgi:hypothetical protein
MSRPEAASGLTLAAVLQLSSQGFRALIDTSAYLTETHRAPRDGAILQEK